MYNNNLTPSGAKQSNGQLTIESLAAQMERLQERVKFLESIIAKSQPSAVRKARKTAFDLTDEQQAIFDRAIAAGLMERTTAGCYHWLASKALLSYFCGRVFCGDTPCNGTWRGGQGTLPAKALEAVFGVTGIKQYRNLRVLMTLPSRHAKVDSLWQ